jgi:hypothetical protein
MGLDDFKPTLYGGVRNQPLTEHGAQFTQQAPAWTARRQASR